MTHQPEFAPFQNLAQQAPLVPVYCRVLCDTLTPVAAFHAIDSGSCSCLFESVVGGERVGRYTFLSRNPGCCSKRSAIK